MDPEARRRACVAFRVKLSRDTGANLTAAACEELLGLTYKIAESGEEVTLQGNPGRFYASLGEAIMARTLPLPLLDHEKVAWWCYREAAEVHMHPGGMGPLGDCYRRGQGVTEDPAQAVAWYQKAADLGVTAAKATLGAMLLNGDARAGIAKDTARGLALVRQAAAEGYSPALQLLARCYLKGEGVAKDAVRAVTLLLELMSREDNEATVDGQFLLAACYATGDGVEADTVQAALWCQKAAAGGDAHAIELLPLFRRCNFCGTTPARKHCERCRKVRYCNITCQAAHWNRESDPHKGHCRRAGEASQQEAGGASTSAQ